MTQAGRVDELLGTMTLEEQVALLAGSSMWLTTPVPRLGVPALKVTDGPNGARGGDFAGGVTAACFPVGIALAASWDVALVSEVGVALGQEARTKGAYVLLGPTVNMHRSPLNGRNFECYSEDPHLTARLAIAYISGLQSQGVGAALKHFACNDSEFERNSISAEVGERALREIYLRPFEQAVREARPWSVMASYNRVNGTFAGENPYLLTEILRGEWGFEGIVMSDWFGTKSTAAAVSAGLDLEMPGPPAWRGERLVQAVRRGEVTEAAVTACARRMLDFLERAGAYERPADAVAPEQAVDRPEHRAVARRAAAAGIVLLRNEGDVLPLVAESLTSLAIIGPNAQVARMMGGGSARVNAHYAVSPYQGIVSHAGAGLRIGFEQGCTNHKLLPLTDPAELDPTEAHAGAARGLIAAYFAGPDLAGPPVAAGVLTSTEQIWFGPAAEGVDPRRFSARFSGRYTPRQSGAHTFGLLSLGLSRLLVNGRQVIDNWTHQTRGGSFFGMGTVEEHASVALNAGQPCEVVLEYSKPEASLPMAGFRLGLLPPLPADAQERAVALAASSDVALLFMGLSDEWESEGIDRPHMDLPAEQVALIEAVAAVNPRTVVVLNTGSPITMPWLDRVAAVAQAWYPGQECGNAIADVLFGRTNPSGRLPQTFPRRLEDNPAYLNYPGENGQVHYGEGLFIGYRYYDKKKVAPLFPFGFGLSYTTFRYDNLRLSVQEIGPDDLLEARVEITNTGSRRGTEVAQLYVADPVSALTRPEKELRGFARVELDPGERRTVTMTLDREALAYYDDLAGQWVAEAGQFTVLVGSSSAHIHASASCTLTATSRFGGRPAGVVARLTIGSTLRELAGDERTREVLRRHVPGLLDSPQAAMGMGFSLEQVAGFAPDVLTPDVLRRIAADLAADLAQP